MSTPPFESETTPEEFRQRALLFADLGRYDDAAAEVAAGLAVAPTDAGLLTTLARVHIAADQPGEALVAAERAAAAAPEEITTLVVRGMALADNRRFAEAARVATDILRRWPDDAYAQRTGAALLSEARNGQEALNAAWHGVKIAEAEPEAHLVLAVVAARLRLFDLAQQAYGKALDLDEAIGDAQRDVGIVRLERHRWAAALETLADEAALGTTRDLPPPDPSDPRGLPPSDPRGLRPDPADPRALPRDPADPPGRSPRSRRFWREPKDELGTAGTGSPEPPDQDEREASPESPESLGGRSEAEPSGERLGAVPPRAQMPDDLAIPISRPTGPVLDPSEDSADGVRTAVLYGANSVLVAALLTALMATASGGASRVWAGLISVIIFVAVPVWLSRRLREPVGVVLQRLRAKDRKLAVGAYLTFVAPLVVLGYALIGGLITLVAAMVVAGVAELLVVTRRPTKG